MRKAIVLLSGGLDSSTILYYAKAKGFSPHCLIFDYGQRHRVELKRASAIERQAGCPYRIVSEVFGALFRHRPYRGISPYRIEQILGQVDEGYMQLHDCMALGMCVEHPFSRVGTGERVVRSRNFPYECVLEKLQSARDSNR